MNSETLWDRPKRHEVRVLCPQLVKRAGQTKVYAKRTLLCPQPIKPAGQRNPMALRCPDHRLLSNLPLQIRADVGHGTVNIEFFLSDRGHVVHG